MKKKDYSKYLKSLPVEAQDPEIIQNDFVLVQADKTVHDQKFNTKPTTFFKDSIRRFRKNKSSVVAAFILGALLLLSIIIPIASPYDVSVNAANKDFEYLEPKLFDAGTGFWDGTRKYVDYAVDITAKPDANEEEKQLYWWPNTKFVKEAISNKTFSDEQYINAVADYSKSGFIQFSLLRNVKDTVDNVDFKTTQIESYLNFTEMNITVKTFDTYDFEKINKLPEDEAQSLDEGYQLAKSQLMFVEYTDIDDEKTYVAYPLTEEKIVHNVGSAVSSMKEESIDVGAKLAELTSQKVFHKFFFAVRINNEKDHISKSSLIRSIEFDVTGSDQIKAALCDYDYEEEGNPRHNNGASFTDAAGVFRESQYQDEQKKFINYGYWKSNGAFSPFMSKVVFCSFTYDSYRAKLGNTKMNIATSDMDNWEQNKWVDFNCRTKRNSETGRYEVDKSSFRCKILDEEHCPLSRELTPDDIYVDYYATKANDYTIKGEVLMYKYHGFTTMPKFLFGTDKNGKDMLKYVFDGLRWSLILGIVSSAVCFIFGLIWGAICGYFGGNVDLIMERFTDILSGIPWIVVMTLVIIRMGSNFFSFALALCLTGWIGTAATTRTQFYRFRGREYVLASRTLGANDARLISKHILPNAMGTIITSAVLMIPSVIFSEATISYLGLGFKNLSSLGVILSNNQSELKQYPHLLIFPAVIIALLMISFNLFGNGLRDAVNPSLKGEDE